MEAARKRLADHVNEAHGAATGSLLRQFILGGQDGLVNVLGVILAVASATKDTRIVLIAGLAATFAESISMAAVAYTSSKAARDNYYKELEMERQEIRRNPAQETQEIRDIYLLRGFRGKTLDDVVKTITADEEVWLKEMMQAELGLTETGDLKPVQEAFWVGVAATFGSVIPLSAFFLMPVNDAVIASLLISVATLFVAGAVKGKLTLGNWVKTGAEMAVVGMVAALVGYALGAALGVAIT
jgi:VIT1/CCC1 family predicted Fe2+/Mn2+ transporter